MFATVLILAVPFLMFDPEYQAPRGLPVYIPVLPKGYTYGRVIVLKVDRVGLVSIDREPVELARLRERLREVFAATSERLLFIQGDLDVDFGKVGQVIDLARPEVD